MALPSRQSAEAPPKPHSVKREKDRGVTNRDRGWTNRDRGVTNRDRVGLMSGHMAFSELMAAPFAHEGITFVVTGRAALWD